MFIVNVLRDKLNWLRGRERNTFKLCLLVYKAWNGMAPNYTQKNLCVPVSCFIHDIIPAISTHYTTAAVVTDY